MVFLFPALQWKNSALGKSQTELLARNFNLTAILMSSNGPKANTVPVTSQKGVIRKARDRNINFWILRWIFIMVMAFWTPMTLHPFALAVSGISNDAKRSRVVDFYLLIWSLTHVSLEPIMFILTIRSLRRKIRHLFPPSITSYTL